MKIKKDGSITNVSGTPISVGDMMEDRFCRAYICVRVTEATHFFISRNGELMFIGKDPNVKVEPHNTTRMATPFCFARKIAVPQLSILKDNDLKRRLNLMMNAFNGHFLVSSHEFNT